MKCLTHDTATCRPSGAKGTKIQDTASIVGAGLPRRRVGGPNPYGFNLPVFRFIRAIL